MAFALAVAAMPTCDRPDTPGRAFLDRDGRIVEILTMQPCPSPNPQFCPTYAPSVPYSAALEMNQGFFARHEVTVGDRIVVAEDRRGRVR